MMIHLMTSERHWEQEKMGSSWTQHEALHKAYQRIPEIVWRAHMTKIKRPDSLLYLQSLILWWIYTNRYTGTQIIHDLQHSQQPTFNLNWTGQITLYVPPTLLHSSKLWLDKIPHFCPLYPVYIALCKKSLFQNQPDGLIVQVIIWYRELEWSR